MILEVRNVKNTKAVEEMLWGFQGGVEMGGLEVLPDDWTAAPKVNRETPRRGSSRNGNHLRFGGGMRRFRGVFWERMGRGEPGMLGEGRERKEFHRSSRQSGREGKEGPAAGNIGQEEREKCRDRCIGEREGAEWGS